MYNTKCTKILKLPKLTSHLNSIPFLCKLSLVKNQINFHPWTRKSLLKKPKYFNYQRQLSVIESRQPSSSEILPQTLNNTFRVKKLTSQLYKSSFIQWNSICSTEWKWLYRVPSKYKQHSQQFIFNRFRILRIANNKISHF